MSQKFKRFEKVYYKNKAWIFAEYLLFTPEPDMVVIYQEYTCSDLYDGSVSGPKYKADYLVVPASSLKRHYSLNEGGLLDKMIIEARQRNEELEKKLKQQKDENGELEKKVFEISLKIQSLDRELLYIKKEMKEI